MEQFFYIREGIIGFYKRYETYVIFLAKFITGFIVFNLISKINFINADVNLPGIPGLPLSFVLGLLFAVLPLTPAYLLIILYITLQTSAVLELALIIALALICVLVFYARLAPKESMLIIVTVLAYYLKIPYLVPMLAGLYFSLASIVPVVIGVFIWHAAPIMMSLLGISRTAGYDIMEIPANISAVYIELLNSLSADSQWIFISFIFVMVIIVVNVVSHLSIDYSKDIAIALGTTVMIVSFIISVLISGIDMGILGILFFTLLSAVILLILRFFDNILDYSRAERVEFEDDENYYYVKIIPKVLMARRNRSVKRIRPSVEYFDEDDDDEYEYED